MITKQEALKELDGRENTFELRKLISNYKFTPEDLTLLVDLAKESCKKIETVFHKY